MEHVVFWAAEGGPDEEFRRVASLDEAVHEVERLRNDRGVDASIFALTPVPVAFRTYYRVEVPGMSGEQPDPAPAAAAQAEDAPPVEPERAEFTAEFTAEPASPELGEFAFAPDLGGAVPSLLPSANAVPQTRRDGEQEHSLGYFAR